MNETNDHYSPEEIAAVAQEIWEEEGQPEGKAGEHWDRAIERLRRMPDNADLSPTA